MNNRYIEMVVDDIGAPKHLKGYDQLISLIGHYLALQKGQSRNMMELYSKVGAEFGVTKNSVERNIRHLVDWMLRHSDIEKIDNYFGASRPNAGGICNSQFVVTLAIAAYRLERADGGTYVDNRR